MKIKKIVAALLAAVLFALCLSACGEQGGKSEATITQTGTTQSNDKKAEPYVTLEKTDTGFGLMTIPKFSETELKKESAALANKMFADIRNGILENIEDFKATGGETPTKDEPIPPLCKVQSAVVGTTLSVFAEYSFYFSDPQENCVAVNFNTETGEAINPREVVKSAGFSEDEVKAALRCFADRSLFIEWEHSAFAELAEDKTLSDGWGDPSLDWQDELDDLEREYDMEAQPTGKEWDKLPLFPTVFVDENSSLFVAANIPTAAGSGIWTTMVQIGHSNVETRRFNSVDRNGEQYKASGAITEFAAWNAVELTMGLDETGKDSNGIECSLSTEYIDNIESVDGDFEPAYIIKVFTDEGTHISTVARYAVGVFTATMWEYDVAADKWNLCPNGAGFLPEDIYTGMQQEAILASVYNEPNDIEMWSASVVDEVDLAEYSTGKKNYEFDCRTSLFFAKTNGTRFVFVSGTMDGDEFQKQKELYSVTLNAGESILVYMLPSKGTPTQAIIVEAENDTGCDTGTYIVQRYNHDDMAKTEYITSDSAMG